MRSKFLVLLIPIFLNCGKVSGQRSIFEGNWKGQMAFSSFVGGRFDVTVEIDHSSRNGYSAELKAVNLDNDGLRKKKFTMKFDCTYENGIFSLKQTHMPLSSLGQCPARFKLNLAFNDNTPVLRGDMENPPCSGSGDIYISKIFSPEELLQYRESYKRALEITDFTLLDNDNNGVLYKYEQGCIQFKVTNKSDMPVLGLRFSVVTSNNLVISGKSQIVDELKPGTTLNISLPASGNSTNNQTETLLELVSSLFNDTIKLYQERIPINEQAFSTSIIDPAFKVKSLEGNWLSTRGRSIATFKKENKFTIKIFRDNVITSQSGKWNHYMDKCDKQEYLSFYDFDNVSAKTYFNSPTPNLYRIKFFDQDFPHNDFIVGINNLPDGNMNTMEYYRIEENLNDSVLISSLDRWLTGKWTWNGSPGSKYNFKNSHQAICYNPINGPESGNWFFTYKKNGSELKVFLWVVMGKTFDTEKYELIFEESSANNMIVKSMSNIQSAKTYYMSRNNEIEVPEYKLIAIRPDGFFHLPDFVFKDVNIPADYSPESEFQKILKLIKR